MERVSEAIFAGFMSVRFRVVEVARQDTGREALPLVAALGDLGQSDDPGLWSTWVSFSATRSADRMIVIGSNPAVAPSR